MPLVTWMEKSWICTRYRYIDARLPSGDGRRGGLGVVVLVGFLANAAAFAHWSQCHLNSHGHSGGSRGCPGRTALDQSRCQSSGNIGQFHKPRLPWCPNSNTFPGAVAMTLATGPLEPTESPFSSLEDWPESRCHGDCGEHGSGRADHSGRSSGTRHQRGRLHCRQWCECLCQCNGRRSECFADFPPSTAHIFVNTSRAVVATVVTGNLILNVSVIRNRVEGAVLDSAGAAIAGASITLTGIGGTRSTVTNAQGAFSFANTPAGDYTVVAQFGAFSAQRTIRVGLIVVGPTVPPILDPGIVVPVNPVDSSHSGRSSRSGRSNQASGRD